ncbi:MAG: PIN domain-containing protein [Verrucomicrobiales bacterium]|nr:PIN domain-containing protein [Verrucomicrobiales bacterium]
MKLSIDTNLFIYAADPDSPYHSEARQFFSSIKSMPAGDVYVCGLVLTEIYMQLRNPAIFKKPYSNTQSVDFCRKLKSNPAWAYIDYSDVIFEKLMDFEHRKSRGFRRVIDARIALTLRHHGVTYFATANVKNFKGFDFEAVINPITDPYSGSDWQ